MHATKIEKAVEGCKRDIFLLRIEGRERRRDLGYRRTREPDNQGTREPGNQRTRDDKVLFKSRPSRKQEHNPTRSLSFWSLSLDTASPSAEFTPRANKSSLVKIAKDGHQTAEEAILNDSTPKVVQAPRYIWRHPFSPMTERYRAEFGSRTEGFRGLTIGHETGKETLRLARLDRAVTFSSMDDWWGCCLETGPEVLVAWRYMCPRVPGEDPKVGWMDGWIPFSFSFFFC